MATFFDDIKAYVGFTHVDSAILRKLKPAAEPHFERISEHFFERILAHSSASVVITGGEPQIDRLKRTLVEWMRSGLEGPHDQAFFQRRARIGRMHMRVELPQQYMLTSMNVLRIDFRRVAETAFENDAETFRVASDALDRLFDLELAIMLETYGEDTRERLARRERLATIGQLAASIGHDLRNPLGVIESSLYLMRKRVPDDPDIARHMQKIGAQIQGCNRIITDLLEMVRDRPPAREAIALSELLQSVVDECEVPGAVAVHLDAASELVLHADPGLLRQALSNLVNNAIQILDGRAGNVWVSARFLDSDRVEISVADDGPGFDDAYLARAFEPLVTSRSEGVGLGLALVHRVVERHGGEAVAGNRPGGGALLTLVLPEQRRD